MEKLKRIWTWCVYGCAIAFLAQLAIAFLGVPSFVTHWLMCRPPPGEPPAPPPRYIMVLGGGGIPSASGLTRTYHAATLHRKYPKARFIVSLPSSGNPATNSVGRMRDELVLHGVPADAVRLESAALNTHEQAVRIARMMEGAELTAHVRVVTNPWHLRRSLACFRKAGFTHAQVEGAATIGAEADPGENTLLRYGIWANMTAGIDCFRECCALLVYKLRGWI